MRYGKRVKLGHGSLCATKAKEVEEERRGRGKGGGEEQQRLTCLVIAALV